MRPTHVAIAVVVCAEFAIPPAHAAESKPDCITLSEVVIVSGAEATGAKRLCKSPGSVRYDLVEAAVYNAALTQAAFERVSDPQLRAMRGEIDRLRAQVAGSKGEATAAEEALARVQKVFVAGLAAKDRAYAEAIAQFRGAVDDIASTPEGSAALAQYNAGNEAEAIAVLDRINAARDAARQKRNDLESAAEKRRIAALALDARKRGKVSVASVIGRFEEVTRLDPGLFKDWFELARLYVEARSLGDAARAIEVGHNIAQDNRERSSAKVILGNIRRFRGDLAGATQAYEESLEMRREIAAANSGNAAAQRDVSESLQKIGDVAFQRGDLAGADKAHSESLDVRRKLAGADLRNAEAQRDVSVGLAKIGDVRVQKGDLAGAEKVYRESLDIRRQLAIADPDAVQAQRDVSISLISIGDVQVPQGDLAGAATSYGESLDIARRLVAADPGNAVDQELVSGVLIRVGDLKKEQADLAGASTAYDETIDIFRRLSATDPNNVWAQRFILAGLQRAGILRMHLGDLAGAEKAFGEGLALARRLAEVGPGNAEAQRDISIMLDRIGDVRAELNDPAGADKAYDESLDIRRRLAEADPENAQAQRAIIVSLAKIGDARRPRGDLAAARQAYGECLEIARRLAMANPRNAQAQQDLALSLYNMAQIDKSVVSWQAVADQFKAMEAEGPLSLSVRKLYDQARGLAGWNPAS